MPLDADHGKTMLQLITSRYDDRHWRKKIEKTLSLPQSGVGDPAQQQILCNSSSGSRPINPVGRSDSWIVGGYATKEIVERAKFHLSWSVLASRRMMLHFSAAIQGKRSTKPGGMRCWCSGSTCRKKRSLPKRSAGRPPIQILRPLSKQKPKIAAREDARRLETS